MKVAKSEREIIDHSEGKGSLDCGLKAFRQGKKVLLCTSKSKIGDVLKELGLEVGE